MADHETTESPTELSYSPILISSSPTESSPTCPRSPIVVPPTPLEPKDHNQRFPSPEPADGPILDTHLSRSPTRTHSELKPSDPLTTAPSGDCEPEFQAHLPQNKPSLHVRTSSAALRRPQSHHRRHSSTHRVRETIDAEQKLLDDGSRIINRYKIGRSLGRGSYASVELATDIGTDEQFAIKEFSKSRLRKQARLQSAPGRRQQQMTRGDVTAAQGGRTGNPALVAADDVGDDDPLKLIRREIAVMKKLDHPNIVHLYAAISSKADALFLVLEYMPGGVLMDVKLGDHDVKSPFEPEQVRSYFRQLVLGLEYLHWNDIVHRDIKPDNILFSEDRQTVKLCDFGVSEMFQTPGDDTLKRSGGTTAFLSPESIADEIHGQTVHAKAVDNWALGVTLYCMLTGKLPFDRDNFEDLRKAIVHEPVVCPEEWSDDLKDLVNRMLCKDPRERIQMDDIRVHPWVTKNGIDPLISTDENLYDLGKHVEEPTSEELGKAIGTLRGAFTVVRAVYKFKRLLHASRVASGRSSPSLEGSPRVDSTAVSSMDSYATDPTSAQDDDLGEGQDVVQSPKSLEGDEYPFADRNETPTANTAQVPRSTTPKIEADQDVASFATAFMPSQAPGERASAFLKLAEFCRRDGMTESAFNPIVEGAGEDDDSLLGAASFIEALVQIQPVWATKLLGAVDALLFNQMLEAAELPSPLQHVVANVLSILAGMKEGRPFMTADAVAWLKGGLRGTSELSALCAVALSKLSRSAQSEEQDGVLGAESSRRDLESQLTRRLMSTITSTPSAYATTSPVVLSAVEGLAYASLTPANKVLFASNKPFLQALLALSSTPPQTSSMPVTPISDAPVPPTSTALIYGISVILANITSRPPKLTAEQTQVAKLRAMATSGQRSTPSASTPDEDPLESRVEVEKRVDAVYAAGVVQAMRGFGLAQSSLVKETIGKLALALVEEPPRRVRFLQEGGFRILSQIVRDLVASPSAPSPNPTDIVPSASLPALQALAKVTITSNPSLLFPPPYLTTAINAVLPLSILLLHSEASLLQQFESMLGLTNLASVSIDLNDRIASFDRTSKSSAKAGEVMRKVEALLLEDNDMVRRAATELICNLAQGDVAFEYLTGATPSARGDPKVPPGMQINPRPILNILLVLITVDDTATRLAASGALASLTECGIACAALFKSRQLAVSDVQDAQRVGVWRRIGELLNGEQRDPGLTHRGVVILYNLLLYVASASNLSAEATLNGAKSAGVMEWLGAVLQSAMQGQVDREVAEVALQGLHVLQR